MNLFLIEGVGIKHSMYHYICVVEFCRECMHCWGGIIELNKVYIVVVIIL
jgi:hypothetical protein